MAASGYEMDPVDREFDRLLAETGRAVSCGTTVSPVSDAAFESLLTAFKSLNVSDTACDPHGKTGRQAPPAAIQAAAEGVAHAWRSLVPSLSNTADPGTRQAARSMQRAVVGLQLAQHAGSPHAVLAVSVACQPFALALDQISEVLDARQVHVERDDARVWAVIGPERIPLHFARHWLAQGDTDTAIAEEAWIVMSVLGTQRAGFVVDGVEAVVAASRQPPGLLLRGMQGIAAVAVAGRRLLPLIDLAALMTNSMRGG